MHFFNHTTWAQIQPINIIGKKKHFETLWSNRVHSENVLNVDPSTHSSGIYSWVFLLLFCTGISRLPVEQYCLEKVVEGKLHHFFPFELDKEKVSQVFFLLVIDNEQSLTFKLLHLWIINCLIQESFLFFFFCTMKGGRQIDKQIVY